MVSHPVSRETRPAIPRPVSVLDQARVFAELRDEHRMTQAQIATEARVSRPFVANALRLLTLPSEVLELIEKGDLSPSHGRLLINRKAAIKIARGWAVTKLTVQEASAMRASPMDVATVGPPTAREMSIITQQAAAATDKIVYFVQAGGADGPVKIGITRFLRARILALKTGNPSEISVLGARFGGRSIERGYHSMFARDRLDGEWFRPTAAVLAEAAKYPFTLADEDARRGFRRSEAGDLTFFADFRPPPMKERRLRRRKPDVHVDTSGVGLGKA